jgi:hypothetical protein
MLRLQITLLFFAKFVLAWLICTLYGFEPHKRPLKFQRGEFDAETDLAACARTSRALLNPCKR